MSRLAVFVQGEGTYHHPLPHNTYYITLYQMVVFSGTVRFSRLAAGLFSCFLLGGGTGGRRGQYGASVGSGRATWPMLYMVKVT